MEKDGTVAVLMATYNGEKYLDEQIQSILGQTYKNVKLIARDDCSHDKTSSIFKKYESKGELILMPSNTTNRGSTYNFSSLYKYAKNQGYDFIMFSDQDDIWDENKIKDSVELIERYNQPSLLYTNFFIWDSDNGDCNKAFTHRYDESFEKIFVQNWLYGCTMLLNKALIDRIEYIPEDVCNHDYWIALVSSSIADAKILYIDTPLVKHRIHSGNVTQKKDTTSFSKRMKRMKGVTFKAEYRIKRYEEWNAIFHEFSKLYKRNDKSSELEKILNNRHLTSMHNAKKMNFKGMTTHTTLVFYLYLLFYNGESSDKI